MTDLFAPIDSLPGVGRRRVKGFARLGIERVVDLLFHLPRRYEDRRVVVPIARLEPGIPALIRGELLQIDSKRIRSRLTRHTAVLQDDTGRIPICFFNQDYILDRSRPGARWVVFGVCEFFRGRKQFVMKDVDLTGTGRKLGQGRVLPFYPATSATTQVFLRGLIRKIVREVARRDPGTATFEGVPAFSEAVRMVHLPIDVEEPERGRRRLALEELVAVRLCVEEARARKPPLERPPDDRVPVSFTLPFQLTEEQERVWGEIDRDLHEARAMRRLVEGDVGSGKTVLGILAAVRAAGRGLKTVLMAPTEILAVQHYETWGERLARAGIRAFLLTGATSKREREEIEEAAGSEEPVIFFGTHALFYSTAAIERLGLVIIDEQQRFGVAQRRAIMEKATERGTRPDLLILTATPIPRTLALTLYGDLEISTLKGLLPGRRPVRTIHLPEKERKRLMPFLRSALEEGDGVYIIYPVIHEEAGAELMVKDAQSQFRKIQKAFGKYGCALLTGETPSEEKRAVMMEFRSGKVQILVATSVVEVGLDVPRATLMIIEHAERFGLSQIHQLRGRVGRGKKPGTCILTTAEELSEYAQRRMEVLVTCTDGFRIAEEDLALRGPGEILGERQHGGTELKAVEFRRDGDLVEQAIGWAREHYRKDPRLVTVPFLKGLVQAAPKTGADVY
ncbi:MAG: ATP-dependent DNA helicase RecG [Candidatus Hydrogenedentota bacterium]|nr:MAG: ATP-dependent DNA helicase RecG [Candidatus Hydrogenedentota bacterium]